MNNWATSCFQGIFMIATLESLLHKNASQYAVKNMGETTKLMLESHYNTQLSFVCRSSDESRHLILEV